MNNDIEVKNYVIRAQAGDAEAFNELDRMFRGKFFYQAMSYVNNVTDAEDIVQNAYIRAYNRIDRCIPEKYVAWMKQIVTNEALAFMKTAHARYDVDFSALEKTDDEGNIEEFEIAEERIENNPELNFETEETKRIVSEMLGALPDTQRFVFAKYYLEDKKIKEISEELSINENTIKTQLSRGKKVLREEATRIEKKYNIKLACSPVSFLVFMLKDLETAYETEALIGGAKLATGSLAGKKAVSTVAEVVKKAVTDNAGKAAAAKITATSVGAKIAAVAVVGALAVGAISNINDNGFLTQTYEIDKTEEKALSQIEKEILIENSLYTANENGISSAVIYKEDGTAYECRYSIVNIGGNVSDEARISMAVDDLSFSLILNNGPYDRIFLDYVPGYSYEIRLNHKGTVVGYLTSPKDSKGRTSFDYDDDGLSDEKVELYKKIDFKKLIKNVEILRNADSTFFEKIVDADMLIQVFTDTDEMLSRYEFGYVNEEMSEDYMINTSHNSNCNDVFDKVLKENPDYTRFEHGVNYYLDMTTEKGETHFCSYSLSESMGGPIISMEIDGDHYNNGFLIHLDNGDYDTLVFDFEDGTSLKIDLKNGKIVRYMVSERDGDSSDFSAEFGYLSNAKAEYFKKVDWKKKVENIKTLREADDTLFRLLIDGDELIRLFNDLDRYLKNYKVSD